MATLGTLSHGVQLTGGWAAWEDGHSEACGTSEWSSISVDGGNGMRGEDELTYQLGDIIRANGNLRRCETEGSPAHGVNEFESQYIPRCLCYLACSKKSNRKNIDICERKQWSVCCAHWYVLLLLLTLHMLIDRIALAGGKEQMGVNAIYLVQLLQFHVATYMDRSATRVAEVRAPSQVHSRASAKRFRSLAVGRKLANYNGVVVRHQRHRVDVGIGNEIAPPEIPPPRYDLKHPSSPEIGPTGTEEAPLAIYGIAERKDPLRMSWTSLNSYCNSLLLPRWMDNHIAGQPQALQEFRRTAKSIRARVSFGIGQRDQSREHHSQTTTRWSPRSLYRPRERS